MVCCSVCSIISLHASLQTLCGGVVQCVRNSEHPCAHGLALLYPNSKNLKSSFVNTRPAVVFFVVCLVCALLRWRLSAPGVGVVLVRAVGSSDARVAAAYALCVLLLLLGCRAAASCVLVHVRVKAVFQLQEQSVSASCGGGVRLGVDGCRQRVMSVPEEGCDGSLAHQAAAGAVALLTALFCCSRRSKRAVVVMSTDSVCAYSRNVVCAAAWGWWVTCV